ncbi:PREDICTED: integral membrane protein GPR155 isoform X1 [Galeopterus variegatus]|uniref:Integral membrane protein GPR155 isoform X1 n=1 Tax=Galeopterus variegatus TaxID=482537 RepID=A0ABM0QE18_GALVR|nr:PREDICTED: integral membrane protein GPR155 isoform X1 [Galeopterus variegatus]XP_008566609.1 PREDICTED: integral membrane protein GPR155 isoform X1 [Galeopterus variegatus]
MNSFSHLPAENLTAAVNMTKTLPTTVIHGFNSTNDAPSMAITRLFPALLECFGIVLCGYIAGRANIITSTQAKGLGNFVSRFALPALLFKNMVILNFSNVDWSFLYSILISKASVFFIVCVLTLLVASPDSRFSKAGLFPIFATQSNDFALGYPIVEALYQTTYPEYLQYIYLVAPISLMMLNPIGFIFCEIQKWKDTQSASQNKVKIVGLGFLRVLQNPIVFMVFIGIAFNFVLDRKVPVYIENFLDGLGNSFSGSALFYLGLTMVGKIKKLKKSAFVVLILLITAKLLVLPLLCREMVELLDKGDSVVNHTSLSNYAFLYGVFPVAPGVAIFATQFNMEVEIVTSGMVISTFVSAPIMYVSAWLLTFPSMDPKPLAYAIQNVSFDISIISLVSLIWSLAILLLSKKYKQLPHMLTTNLLIAQSIVCAGMMVWNFVKEKNFVGQILVFVLLYSSLYSTYLWTGLLAVSLFLLKKRERVHIPVGIIVIAGWGIPAVLVGVLLITGKHNGDSIDSAFFYGKEQMITTAVTLFCSILIAGISLMCMNRTTQAGRYEGFDQSQSHKAVEPGNTAFEESPAQINEPELFTSSIPETSCCSCSMGNGELHCPSTEPVANTSTSGSVTPPFEKDDHCVSRCTSQSCMLAQEEEQYLQSGDQQLTRHVFLCLLLIIGLFANLSSCLWWLFNQEPGRLYVELQFFCAVFNFGQGFISFGIFGLDKHLIILPFKRRLEFLWNNKDTSGNRDSPVSEEIKMTCQQFIHYHRDLCIQNIVKERRCGAKTSAGTFCGYDLVNWLIEVGLASDRGEAVIYGDRLVQGGVIQHITNEYEFRDEYLFYRFLQKNPEQSPPVINANTSQQERYKEIEHSSPSSLSRKT